MNIAWTVSSGCCIATLLPYYHTSSATRLNMLVNNPIKHSNNSNNQTGTCYFSTSLPYCHRYAAGMPIIFMNATYHTISASRLNMLVNDPIKHFKQSNRGYIPFLPYITATRLGRDMHCGAKFLPYYHRYAAKQAGE